MAYNFYIDEVQLPITPSKLQIKISNKNKTITLINNGEINLLKKAGLIDIEFDAIIPQVNYPFATYVDGFKPASYFLEKLDELKTSEKSFQFIVSRISPGGELLFDTNLKVSLENYIITEDAKNGLDLTASIKLKQYQEFGTKTVTAKRTSSTKVASISTTKPREVTKSIPKTHTVIENETLWTICKKEFGDGEKYPEVAELNGINNPNSIYIGQVIRLA